MDGTVQQEIPFWEKFSLTIQEASEYFGIGTKKIRELLHEPDCDFVFYIGKKTLIKRKKMEEYVNNTVYM